MLPVKGVVCPAGSSATTAQGDRRRVRRGQQMVERGVSLSNITGEPCRRWPSMAAEEGAKERQSTTCSEENQSSNFDGVIGNE